MDHPLVSVVVLTRDRSELLLRCLRSILDNSYDNVEIVVYNTGTETTRQSVESLFPSDSPRSIKYVESQPAGFAEMRQAACSHTAGQIIMSIDDDCTAESDAIAHIVRRFRSDEGIGIVGGNITNVGFEGAEQLKGRGRIGVNGRYEPVDDISQADVFGSANKSVRKKAFDEARGYDPFFADGLEEADLTLSIKARGYRIVYDPDVKITHYHSTNRFKRRRRNLHIARLYLFFKHDRPRSLVAWLRFVGNEVRIFFDDVKALATTIRHGVADARSVRRVVGLGAVGIIELGKMMWARVVIPHLALKTRSVAGPSQSK